MWTRFSVLTALEGENGLECWRISVRYSGLGETGLNVVSTSPTLLPSLSLSFSFVPRSPLSAFVLFSIVVPCPCFPTPLSRPEIDCSRFVAWQHVERENCADQAALLPHYLYRRGDGSRQTYAECVCVCVHRFNVLVTLSPYRAVECRDCPYTLLWMIQLRTTLFPAIYSIFVFCLFSSMRSKQRFINYMGYKCFQCGCCSHDSLLFNLPCRIVSCSDVSERRVAPSSGRLNWVQVFLICRSDWKEGICPL